MSSSSPPRRTRLPRAERERQILDAAHELFAARGYEAVTMDEVAAQVGVTKPLLYAYSGNKEQLYLASLERSADALKATVVAAVEGASGPDDAFRSGVGAFFAFVDSDRDAWRVLFAETSPAGGAIARHVAEFRQGLVALVAGTLIARLPAEHRDRPKARAEVEALSHAMLGAAESLARWWVAREAGTSPGIAREPGAPPMTAGQASDLLVSTVLPGLRDRARGQKPSPSGDPAP